MAEKKSILLRLSPKMWEEISQWAEEEFRSVNGQIEYLISDALRRRKRSYKDEPLVADGYETGNQESSQNDVIENTPDEIVENAPDDIVENATDNIDKSIPNDS